MVEHGEESHLMTTVSLAGLLPGSGTYGVSKHAVMALTEAARNDLLAARCERIRIGSVSWFR